MGLQGSSSKAAIPADEDLPYLKKTRAFRRPLKASRLGGMLMLCLLLLLMALVGAIGAVIVWSIDPPSWWIGPIAVIPGLYLAFLVYCRRRWLRYFEPLNSRKESFLNQGLPYDQAGLKATPMSMRPITIPWPLYLWCMHVMWPGFVITAFWRLFVRHPWWMRRIRTGAAAPPKPLDEVFGEFMLETTAFIWFVGFEPSASSAPSTIARFSTAFLGKLRTITADGGTHDISAIQIDVDVTSRKVVGARYDGVEVSTERAFVQVLFAMTTQIHAWLHAASNFAVDQLNPRREVANQSAYTLFFSHMGFDYGLPLLAKRVRRPDMLVASMARNELFADVLPFDDEDNMMGPLQAQVPAFGEAGDCTEGLIRHSRFVAFVHRMKPVFMEQLAAAGPPSITPSAEALFLCTVVHCTDHWMFVRMFDSADKMASIVKAGEAAVKEPYARDDEPRLDYAALVAVPILAFNLADDWPHLVRSHFRNSTLPFYRTMYEEAKKLDPELAYHLQSCIIK